MRSAPCHPARLLLVAWLFGPDRKMCKYTHQSPLSRGVDLQIHVLQHPPRSIAIILVLGSAGFNYRLQNLVADPSLLDQAVEEVLRWSTPVLHMRRTATVDTTLAGTAITSGDKVVMWYCAANRDPSVFDEPHTFDVGRVDNPHFAFGGGGPHFCLGAFLARMEIKVLLDEMRRRAMVLEQLGPELRAPSNFVHGVLKVQMGIREAPHG